MSLRLDDYAHGSPEALAITAIDMAKSSLKRGGALGPGQAGANLRLAAGQIPELDEDHPINQEIARLSDEVARLTPSE